MGGTSEEFSGQFFGAGAPPAPPSTRGRKRDLDPDRVDAGGGEAKRGRSEMMVGETELEPDDEGPGIAVAGGGDDGWQDKDDYELAQDDGGLELLQDRTAETGGARLSQPARPREEGNLVAVRVNGADADNGAGKQTALSKEERKKLKKQRLKDERRKKEEAKAGR